MVDFLSELWPNKPEKKKIGLDPLLEDLLAQFHVDLSSRGFGRNRPGTCGYSIFLLGAALVSTELRPILTELYEN